ncbi:MAG: acetyl-CoA acetyltransferase, partial [Pseudomonadota bacterium]
MSKPRIYILGGYQSDFAQNWARQGVTLFDSFANAVRKGLESAALDAHELGVGHVGNFVSDLFTGQAHLGGFFGHVDPALCYLPASRHEAACASGSMALLAAMADLEAGRYDLACVLGIEMMRNVSGDQAAANLRAAAWVEREWCDTPYVWPCAFDQLVEVYRQRHGIDRVHLAAISEKNFANARRNPNAQTRHWQFGGDSFTTNDAANPVISGHIRRQDCGQITDGAAVVFLATESRARQYAQKRGIALDELPWIQGWGHINAPMLLAEKLLHAEPGGYLFPHIRELFRQTLARAGLPDVRAVDGLEVHDCFNITEYMILDHTGLNAPGEAWRAIENGTTARGGRLPVNASGGLIGLGHPVGATGVRMALDCYRQVRGIAGDCQI